jgi:hypothetical protein
MIYSGDSQNSLYLFIGAEYQVAAAFLIGELWDYKGY